MVFHDMEELALCFEANINNAIPVYVYSASTDAVRVVNITPNTNWGGLVFLDATLVTAIYTVFQLGDLQLQAMLQLHQMKMLLTKANL